MLTVRGVLARAGICLVLATAASPFIEAGVADAAGPEPAGTIYVADYGGNGGAGAIDVFAAGSTGGVAPIRQIEGSNTLLAGPADVAVDAAGDVYASNFNNSTITEYGPGANGNVTPIRTIGGSNTGLDFNDDMALAGDGTLYVGNASGGSIVVFAPGASGNALPTRTISGSNTTLGSDVDGVGVDSAGNLYVANVANSSVVIFAPGANGNVAPIRTISGANTGLSSPDDVKVSFDGSILVSNGGGLPSAQLLAFAAGANGDVAPTRSVTSTDTSYSDVDDLGVSANGTAYVSYFSGAVEAFGPAQNGTVNPIAVLAGGNTTLVSPEGVDIAPAPAPTITTTTASPTVGLGTPTSDTASITGNSVTAPTGQIVFKAFGPNDSNCSSAPAFTSSNVNVDGNGNYPSPSFSPKLTGTYSWEVQYSGDTENGPTTTACGVGSETFTVTNSISTTTSTTVYDAATNAKWNSENPGPVTGSSAYDLASVSPNSSSDFTPSGTVTFDFFTNDTCTGTPTSAAVTLSNGQARAPDTGALAAGSYSYQAHYSGDTHFAASTATCEPFTVVTATPSVSGEVFDAGNSQTWGNSEPLGTAAYDTASVTGVDGFPPSGSVTFTLYPGGSCTGTQISSGSVDLSDGSATSGDTSPLRAGTYSFLAHYGGDGNYAAGDSCVAFVVAMATPTVSSPVFDASSKQPWGQSSEQTGATAYTTATVTGSGGFTPTGNVQFTILTGGTCSGGQLTQPSSVGLSDGSATSPTSPALGAGTYSFEAQYQGDGNFNAASTCTSFTVSAAPTTLPAQVNDEATKGAWTNKEVSGAVAYGSATLTGQKAGFDATGFVTFSFYTVSGCTTAPFSLSAKGITGGNVPNSNPTPALGPGTYYMQATYPGDTNYGTSASSCASFTVLQATPAFTAAVDDASSGQPWSGSEVTGASADGSSSVTGTGVAGFTPTGSVTYTFYTQAGCTSGQFLTSTKNLSDGTVPNSDTTSGLAPGTYYFAAAYSGDTNYKAAAASCTSFSVKQATPTVSGAVDDAATGKPWSGSEVTGASAVGTSSVTGVDVAGFTPTGNVTYDFYNAAGCETGLVSTSTVGLLDGTVPNSSATPTLAPGTYYFAASYLGDSNYKARSTSCTSFAVKQATPTVTAPVVDASNNEGWAGTEVTGASAYDAATVTGVDVSGFTPTGSVTYDYFATNNCSGSPTTTQTVTLSGGAVPVSSTEGPLGAGTYAFNAAYSGDGDYLGVTVPCQTFTVSKSPTTTATSVVEVPIWQGEVTGSSAYDTASVSPGISGFTDTGSVSYFFYDNGQCSGRVEPQTVSLSGGSVPNSATTAPLTPGSYSFEAAYSGDGNYMGSTGSCQSFTVEPATPETTQDVEDAATGQSWAGTEVTGAAAFDTLALGGVPGFTPTGGVTYDFFLNGTCSGAPASMQTVPVSNGTVPASANTSPLHAGIYSWTAAYSGDGNYLAETAGCNNIPVGRAPTATAGSVRDSATGAAWSGNETQGASAFDNATVAGVRGFLPSGTVTYVFYRDGSCSAPASTSEVDALAGGLAPSSAATGELPSGDFSYRVSYSGSADYLPSVGACQPFSTAVIGYRLFGGDGGVFAFHSSYRGSVGFPSPPGLGLKIYDFTGVAATTNGYWLVEADGGVFAFGSSHYLGSLPGSHVSVDDIVGIAATSDGGGYWMVSRDGTIYPFGDAVSHGDLPGSGVKVGDIVAIGSVDSGGYWLVGANGAVYGFGDAHFHGSCPQTGSGCQGIANVVGFAAPDGGGYWLVARNGNVYGFGDAHFHGSCAQAGSGCQGVGDVVGIAAPDTGGYWIAGSNGGLYAFGDAHNLGNEVGADLVRPIVAVT